jgi:hypothetical protein
MTTNLDRVKKDLDALLELGGQLEMAMQYEAAPKEFKAAVAKAVASKELKSTADEFLEKLPSFSGEYQRWYSESIALLRQLLPDRVADFVRHYEKPKGRKDITFEKEVVVDSSAAIPQFRQQLAMLKAAKARFESSLFEIRQLVQADLLDSELEAAEVLAKHKFTRAAGALAGVVLERHLSQVCVDRKLPTGKKNPTIADFNETLKAGGAIDLPQWRFIQHLADIRNLCDHSRTPEPTADQVTDLLAGAKKVTKTVY